MRLPLLVGGYPDVQSAMAAILLEADEIIVKPFEAGRLAEHRRWRASRCRGHDCCGLATTHPLVSHGLRLPVCDWTIAGNKWLTKRASGTKTSADLKAPSGNSTAPDSMMMGVSGLRRLSCPLGCSFPAFPLQVGCVSLPLRDL